MMLMLLLLPFTLSVTAVPLTGLLNWSRTVTVMVLVSAPATSVVGEPLISDCAAEMAPGVTVTSALSATAALFTMPEMVAVPVEVTVSVAPYVPFALLLTEPMVPSVELSVTASVPPPSGLLNASRKDTAIATLPTSAEIVATSVVIRLVALAAAAGATVTAACCVMLVPSTIVEIDFSSARVELKVATATPELFVTASTLVKLLSLPVALNVTEAPTTRLLFASRAVTVTRVVPLPAMMFAVPTATVDVVAETLAGVTVSDCVCVMATVAAVALTVLVPATVEEIAPVAAPLALVVAAGWTMALPVPVAAITTEAPLMALPNWSRAVTVTLLVELPSAAMLGGDMATVDCAAETAPTPIATTALSEMLTPLRVPMIVAEPGTADVSVAV